MDGTKPRAILDFLPFGEKKEDTSRDIVAISQSGKTRIDEADRKSE